MSLSRILKSSGDSASLELFPFRYPDLADEAEGALDGDDHEGGPDDALTEGAGADGERAPSGRERRGRTAVIHELEIDGEVVKRAFEEGYQAGRDAGVRVGREEVHGAGQALAGVLGDLDGLRTRLFRRSETQALEVVLYVAEMVLGHELRTRPELVLSMIQRGLEAVGTRDRIAVFVHPKVYEVVAGPGSRVRFSGFEHVELSADPELAEDGFRIQNDLGEVDSSVHEQIEEIARRLDLRGDGTER